MIGKLLSGAAAKVLAALDSPATGSDIVLGKEAYNSNGDKITGTLESINNPWKPSSQSEYDTIVASKNRVGNYIEYAGKTTKVMPATLSGVFDIGDTVTDVWFDTSITPSLPSFTEWDVTGISYNSKYYRVKYLMAGDDTWTFGDATLKQGIMIIKNESNSNFGIYFGYPHGEDTIIYSNSASDFLIEGWIFDYNTELETKVTFDKGLTLTTLLSSGYSWNGYFAFKNRNAQYGKEYYSLSKLSTPATAKDILSGKRAYSDAGKLIRGTYEPPQNPWAPSTESEYTKLLVPNNVGNFFDYDSKITRLESVSFSDSLAVNDSITNLYFDTTKTPTIPDFSSGYEEFEGNKLIYLFKTSATSEDSLPDCGLFWMQSDSFVGLYYVTSANDLIYIYGSTTEEDPTAMQWLLDMNADGNPIGFTLPTAETITSLNSDYNWNGVYVFKNKTTDIAEYQKVGGGGGGGELTASTEAEMSALLVVDNVGKVVKFVGEDTTLYKKDSFYLIKYIGGFAVGDKPNRVYFNTDITPDLSFAADYITADNAVYNIITCDGQVIPDDGILQISVFTPSSEIGTSLGLSNNMYWLTAGDCQVYLQVAAEDVDKLSTLGIGSESINTWLHTDVSLNVSATADLTITSVATETEKYWSVFVSGVQNNIVAKHLYELPILTNEGTAEDLAQGKELINSNGEKIVGTASGGGDIGTGDYTVKVIDYDGTVLLEKKGNTGDVIDLPIVPTNDKLVFQEWSTSVAVSDNKVTIADNDIMVGAVYTTASGQNEFDITLTKGTGKTAKLNMDGTKDWGDGTSDTATSHTYTTYGDYTIKCNGTTMTTSSSAGLFGQASGKNYYCTAIRFATVTSISEFAFQYCDSLTNIVIPNSVTSIGNAAFYLCYSLTNIIIPNGVTSIGNGTFNHCYSLTNIVIPNGVTNIGSNEFFYCYSLTSIIIPNGITSIGGYAFRDCYSLTKYDFSQCTAIPTLSNTNAFSGINSICKIIVPDSLYNSWIAASNWSTYADYIYKASEVA